MRFPSGCILVDHASDFISINNQVAIAFTENDKAKPKFQRDAQIQVLVIKEYHTDNQFVNASDYMQYLFKNEQKIRYIGAGTSHQNGVEDLTIKILVNIARTTLIHAAIKSSNYANYIDIYQMTMLHDVQIYNCIPGMHSGISNIQIQLR